ncbi:MAG: hypothetical protein H6728_10495 [Myxococcales bacterium]|nr:hypothetical protein [Myxococcales bacterium]
MFQKKSLGWLGAFLVGGMWISGLWACHSAVEPAPAPLATSSQQHPSPSDPSFRITKEDQPRHTAGAPTVYSMQKPALTKIVSNQKKNVLVADDAFVVHEWGTFTSLQGSDGTLQEGMQHEDEKLPEFVYRRGYMTKGTEQLFSKVTQKLETPVIYFYTQTPQKVRVEVKFPLGVISEWYPDAIKFLPELHSSDDPKDGMMLWEGDLKQGDADVPSVKPDSVWQPSREVPDAVPFYTKKKYQPDMEVEKFIFYRGVGRFDGEVFVKSQEQFIEIENRGALIPAAFLLTVKDGLGSVQALQSIAAQSTASVSFRCAAPLVSMEEYLKNATTQLAAALIQSGLYKDEAWAMVNTWRHSYFQTPGTRLLYIVPRAQTDALLPIDITPKPTELVRTLVGRVEIFLASEEKALMEKLRVAHEQKQTLNLNDLGRFVEPRLRRVHALFKEQGQTELAAYSMQLAQQAMYMP